jgi:hypothetical protein
VNNGTDDNPNINESGGNGSQKFSPIDEQQSISAEVYSSVSIEIYVHVLMQI